MCVVTRTTFPYCCGHSIEEVTTPCSDPRRCSAVYKSITSKSACTICATTNRNSIADLAPHFKATLRGSRMLAEVVSDEHREKLTPPWPNLNNDSGDKARTPASKLSAPSGVQASVRIESEQGGRSNKVSEMPTATQSQMESIDAILRRDNKSYNRSTKPLLEEPATKTQQTNTGRSSTPAFVVQRAWTSAGKKSGKSAESLSRLPDDAQDHKKSSASPLGKKNI